VQETWYYIVAEFKALGLRCIAYGPEFWLGVSALAGAGIVAVLAGLFVFGEDENERR